MPRARAGARPAGEPLVQIAAIGYSPVAEQRVVTLRVNGGPATTLHEGESADGVDVQLIMPGSVYVRHAGQIFAVDVGG